MTINKREALQNSMDWINEGVFKNAYQLSIGQQMFALTDFDHLSDILKSCLSKNKQYHSRTLTFVNTRFPIPEINFEDLKIALRLMEDELTELDFDSSTIENRDNIKYKKLLTARYNNLYFDEDLYAILSDNPRIQDTFSRHVLHKKECCKEDIILYITTSNTVKITKDLEEMQIPTSYSDKKISEQLAALINKSLQNPSTNLNFDSILQIDTITQALVELKEKSTDSYLNQLITNAKNKWIKGEIFDTAKELWDILERIKTIIDKNKRNGVQQLTDKVAANIYLSDEKAFKRTKELFDEEFKLLTSIGNEYTIRHSETDKFEIYDKTNLLKYLIKRVSALLELFIEFIPTHQNIDSSQ